MNETPQPSDSPKRNIEDIISPEHLQIISKSSGKFWFELDYGLPPSRLAYTELATRVIHLNPIAVFGSEELEVEPMSSNAIRGILLHECGHHAPDVVTLQDKMMNHLKSEELYNLMPEDYKGDEETEMGFIRAVSSNLHNALADVWLEAYLSRRPYENIRNMIETTYTESPTPSTWVTMPKPDQLIQSLLFSRYIDIPEEQLATMLDADVFESFQKLTTQSLALEQVMDTGQFSYFATEHARKKALEIKFDVYRKLFLPEYIHLMQAEINDRREQEGMPQRGEGQGSDPVASSVPMTKKEKQMLKDLVSELIEAGETRGCHAHDTEDDKKNKAAFEKELKDFLEGKRKSKENTPMPPIMSPEEYGIDRLRELAEQLRREREKQERGELAAKLKIREQSIVHWKAIKEKRRQEIDSLSSSLAEVFLDDRRKRIEFLHREGDIVPGLEYETIAAVASGDMDPETKMREVRNPEFLKTEVEFIVDTSGSMRGIPIEKSIEMLVVVTEAFKQVRETLEAENLVLETEDPFKIGVTAFDVESYRITQMDEDISDEKELNVIDKLNATGGGTDEQKALINVYDDMTLRKNEFIKMIIVLSDGHGNKDTVHKIMRQIEQDDEVIFLAIGLGSGADGVIDTYLAPLRDREKNVFGISAVDPETVLPEILTFLRREVNKRRKVL